MLRLPAGYPRLCVQDLPLNMWITFPLLFRQGSHLPRVHVASDHAKPNPTWNEALSCGEFCPPTFRREDPSIFTPTTAIPVTLTLKRKGSEKIECGEFAHSPFAVRIPRSSLQPRLFRWRWHWRGRGREASKESKVLQESGCGGK
jgi:hypothetical protein